MPFLELCLRCGEAVSLRYERALEDAGALAVTLLDAEAGTGNEQAILEPGVGQLPMWDAISLCALFKHDTDGLSILALLETSDPMLDWSRVRFREVEDQDWERAWMDQYEPMRFGERTWVVPWNCDVPLTAKPGRSGDNGEPATAIVRLDPGLAFGSGTHQTTALCLQWLDALAGAGRLQAATVLDFGCGSGILALAALKLGAARAVAVDNDPQALLATRDNAQRNGVDDRLATYSTDDEPHASYQIVVANILAGALDTLADILAARVTAGGRIAISGILAGQQDALLQRYGEWFDRLNVARQDDWIRIDGIRRR